MSESLYSPLWYRVAGLKPRLRRHVLVRRHRYRGETWYILQDSATGKAHRLNSISYLIVGLMDGNRTIHEIWNTALDKLGDDAPTQDEVIRLFGSLHAADVLQCDVSPEAAELHRRYKKSQRSKWMQRFLNPMAVRIPLVDPDKFLTRTMPGVRWLFSPLGAVLWLSVVVLAGVQVAAHWQELTRNITDQALSPGNLVLLLVVFPIVKALHELGHGYAVKRWGGEVHDMGVMLLVLMPVPYVDATAAWAFREKSRRMIVGAAGMMVELLVASLATFGWVAFQPGLLRAVMFNVMLVAGVSTILFNGNPLLRFDGYYIFADWLEMPNLAARAKKYLAQSTQKRLFGARDLPDAHVRDDERWWLTCYAIASFVYRLFVAAVIIVFIAGKFFTVGILLAVWVVCTMLLLPLAKGVHFLLRNPALRSARGRALSVSAGATAALVAIVGFVPVPFMTRAQGVVWLPEQSHVRTGTSGFVAEVVASPSTEIRAGDLLVRLEDPSLLAEVSVARARLNELTARYRAELTTNRVDAELTKAELEAAGRALARLEERVAELEVRAATNGRFVVPNPEDLAGRHLAQGETIGWVIGSETPPRVRVATTQFAVDLIRARTRDVTLRLVSDLATEHPARLLREVPAASNELPSAALSRQGGGDIPNDPRAQSVSVAFERVFQFELEMTAAPPSQTFGERVYVRFNHGYAPLWSQWYRRLKILLLRLLDD